MTQANPEPDFETVNFEVGLFRYSDRSVPRAMITVTTRLGSTFRFASTQVDIHPLDSVRLLGLTEQGQKMVAEVRQAGGRTDPPLGLIRLGPHHATFGPYPMNGVAENTAAILIAIRNAYLPFGLFRLTFIGNWPEQYLNATLGRIKRADCVVFIAQVRVSRVKQLRSSV